jgi:hypothetical protein
MHALVVLWNSTVAECVHGMAMGHSDPAHFAFFYSTQRRFRSCWAIGARLVIPVGVLLSLGLVVLPSYPMYLFASKWSFVQMIISGACECVHLLACLVGAIAICFTYALQ